MPTNDEAVEIGDVTTEHGRILSTGHPTYVTAMHFPATEYRSEEWRICAQLDLPTATVHNENDARAWLEFLARKLAPAARPTISVDCVCSDRYSKSTEPRLKGRDIAEISRG